MQRASELNPELWILQEKVARLALQCEDLQLAKDTLAKMREKWGHEEDVMNAVCTVAIAYWGRYTVCIITTCFTLQPVNLLHLCAPYIAPSCDEHIMPF